VSARLCERLPALARVPALRAAPADLGPGCATPADALDSLHCQRLTASRKPAEGRKPPVLPAPDIGRHRQRVVVGLVHMESSRLASAVRTWLPQSRRD